MSALSNARKRRSPVEVISRWWQVWTNNSPAQEELTCCAAGEVERIAKDIGMPASEFRKLASLGPQSAELLLRRMAALTSTAKRLRRWNRKPTGICSVFARCVKVTGNARVIFCVIRATRHGRNIARTLKR